MIPRNYSSGTGLPSLGAKGKWVWSEGVDLLEFEAEKESEGKRSQRKEARANFDAIYALIRKHEDVAVSDELKEKVQLKQVKLVAIDYISSDKIRQMGKESITIFDHFFKLEEIDDFIWQLLLYMRDFLECVQTNPSSEFAISNNNRQTNIAAAKERLETSRKILANLYCSLILGVKIEEFHHMKAGKSRCSKTRADREFYDENLRTVRPVGPRQIYVVFYEYLMRIVWITFHRQHWSVIQNEVGRLLRTSTFNREIPLEEVGESNDFEDQSIDGSKLKALSGGILSSTRSRTPMLSSVLPTAKDSAAWVFQPPYIPTNETKCDEMEEQGERKWARGNRFDNALDKIIGIIGEPVSKYDERTLLPIDETR